MEVEPDDSILLINTIFRDWIKIFYRLIEEENVEQNTITETIKDIKFDYIANNIVTENDQEPITALQKTEILEKIKSEFI